MVKVCFTTSYIGNSGANHSLVALCKKLKEMRIVPIVVVPKEGYLTEQLQLGEIDYKIIRSYPWVIDKQKKKKKVEKFKWRIKQVINYVSEYRLSKYLEKECIRIIHINAFTTSFGFQAAKKNNVSIVWHIREFIEEDLNKELWSKEKSMTKLFKSDKIVCISEAIKKKYFNKNLSEKFLVIYNGVSFENISRKEKNLFSKESTELLLVGRITEKKGQYESLVMLNKFVNNISKDVKLKFVGGIQDNVYYKKLLNYIEEKNLKNNVEFLELQENVYPFIANTDLLLVPSYQEAFGRVTIEGNMVGRVVIGSDSGATGELLHNKETGLLFSLDKADEFYEAVKFAYENKKLSKEIAEKGRSFAKSTFTVNKNALLIKEVYKELL